MKHFLIYTNRLKDENGEITNRITDYLRAGGHKAMVVTGENGLLPDYTILPEDACCMLVLGTSQMP